MIADDFSAIADRLREIKREPAECQYCAYARSLTPPLALCDACAAKAAG